MRGALILNEARELVIGIKRIYDAPSRNDGYRVLVDRLWPRGMNKGKAGIDIWLKEVAPSDELRKWFNHEPQKWGDFRKRYFANNAIALKEYSEMKMEANNEKSIDR